MSTNFYVREASVDTETGRRVFNEIHIGKRSGGWVFHFQGEERKTVAAWKEFTSTMTSDMEIVDEYGAPYTPEEFWQAVEETKQPWGSIRKTPAVATYQAWRDEGFSFYAGEFS